MVITVEPGIYFIEAHFSSKEMRQKTRHEIDWARAEKYKSVGGIRIEDDVVVTKTGHLNLTTVPKEVREIEMLIRRKLRSWHSRFRDWDC
jgi:Xaa-Pro dipeptidase